MKRSVAAGLVVLMVGGCGKKADDAENALSAMAAAATAAPKVEEGLKEAERFQKERVARGDTVAMSYRDLQKFLPASISGYTPGDEPSGSQQAMAGFSMSQTSQTWVGTPDAAGATPEIEVTIVDFGGTQQGYAMMAAPMMMGFSQEDAHRRVGSTKVDVPHAGAWEEYDKDTKEAKITAIARYRFVITVESRHKGEDQSAMVKAVAEEVAAKFDGK